MKAFNFILALTESQFSVDLVHCTKARSAVLLKWLVITTHKLLT